MRTLVSIIFTCLCLQATTLHLYGHPDRTESGLPVQEKVYLHFDNSNYFLGDTLWYKAYVVRADNNCPEPLSRILYVELLNEQGYLMERQQLVVDSKGQADGCFAFSDSLLFAGFYEVRAYTKWMLNFGYEHLPSWNKKVWWQMEEETALFPLDIPATPPTTQYIHALRAFAPGRGVIVVPDTATTGRKPIAYNNADNFIQYPAPPDSVYNVSLLDEYKNNFQISRDGGYMNYRDYSNLFSRVIPVYSRPDSMQNYRRRIMPTKITMGDFEVQWKTPEFDVRFYPEGGALLTGHRCRVAWEALSQEMERLNVSGILMEDGVPIDSVCAVHAGRGVFFVNVRHGRKYKVVFTFGKQKFTFTLPDAESEGVAMRVGQDDDNVYMRVMKQFAVQRKLTLGVYCRGRKVAEFPLAKEGTDELCIDKRDMPEGVSQALVHDAEGTVYADRLFFVNKCYESVANVEVLGIPDRPYRPMEHIRLNLLLTDARGRPMKDEAFSVAVRDADQLDPTFATGNIMTNLLLESDLKGFIEAPDYYFEADDSIHRLALDLLMMVQGWRRYDWHDVEHPDSMRLDFPPEQKTIIRGDVFNLRSSLFGGNPGPIQVSATLFNSNEYLKEGDTCRYKGVVECDSLGRFSFAYDPFYGDVHLSLRAKYADKLGGASYDRMFHDPKIFIRKEYFYPQTQKAYSWYETHQPDTLKVLEVKWEDILDDIYASEWIPQVTIKSKRRPHAKRQLDKPVFSMDFLDFVNNLWDQGYYDSFYLMDYSEYNLLENQPLFHSFVRLNYAPSFNNHEGHAMSLNWDKGDYIDKARLNSYLPAIDRIDIVSDAPRRPTPYEHVHLDRQGGEKGVDTGYDTYINLMTLPEGKTRILHGREYTLHGFTRPVEYYHPDYSHARLPEVKDYRRTLYWNPDLRTDQYGQATISFYNNSVCTTIDISAEGITRYGQFITNKQ